MSNVTNIDGTPNQDAVKQQLSELLAHCRTVGDDASAAAIAAVLDPAFPGFAPEMQMTLDTENGEAQIIGQLFDDIRQGYYQVFETDHPRMRDRANVAKLIDTLEQHTEALARHPGVARISLTMSFGLLPGYNPEEAAADARSAADTPAPQTPKPKLFAVNGSVLNE